MVDPTDWLGVNVTLEAVGGLLRTYPGGACRSGPGGDAGPAGRVDIGSGQPFESGRAAPASIVPQRKRA
jgi:hypothetical protein